MRSKEDLIRAFVQTDPAPKDFSVSAKEDSTFVDKTRQYQRERLMLEVLLDIRDALKKD